MKKRLALLLIVVMLLGSLAPLVMAQDDAALVIWADDTRAPIVQEVGAAFSEEFGVPVVIQEMGIGDIRDQLKVAGPAGEGPDVIVGAHDWLGELVINGMLAPIDLGDRVSEYTESSVAAFTYDGELYGLPYAVENVALLYNTDLVDEAPATWEEVAALSAEIQESGAADYGYLIHTNDPYHWMPMFSAHGGYVFGVDENGAYVPSDLGIDSEGGIAAGKYLEQLVQDGLIPTDVTSDVLRSMFESGQAAMIVTGPWDLTRFREAGVPFAVAASPSAEMDAMPFLGVQGFMISNFSEQKLLAEIFLLDYIGTPEVMQAIAEAGTRPPAMIELEGMVDEQIAGFMAAGMNGRAMPAIPEMGSVWSAWGNAMELIIRQQSDAETAVTDAATQIRTLLATDLTGVAGLPGSHQAAVGCDADWDPACEVTFFTDNGDGTYNLMLTVPAGDYEFKVAMEGAWTENYGVDGEPDGANYTLSLAEDTDLTFTYDGETNLLTWE